MPNFKVFDNYAMKLRIGEDQYVLRLFDTAGEEDYERLRLLAYPNTDVILVCFSITNPDSFDNVRRKWIPEIKANGERTQVPFILVGTQMDLRTDPATVTHLGEFREGSLVAAPGPLKCFSATRHQNLAKSAPQKAHNRDKVECVTKVRKSS